MKISKRQLRRIIRESINEALPPHLQKHFRADGSSVKDPEWKDVTPAGYGPDDEDYSAPASEEDYYAPGGEGEQATDTQLKKGWTSWLEERGLEFEDLDDLALAAGAPNRTWLDSGPPHDGFIGPLDVEVWVKDMQAAKEILTTRMGSYKGTVLPGGKKIAESKIKITKRQLRKIVREAISLDIEKGDIVLTGKFKNKRSVVKDIGTDKNGHPTINGKSILKLKIEKLLPQDKWSKKSKEKKDK